MPGVGVEQMKEYKKNGSFTVNGVFYSNEMLTIKTTISKNILILDIPDDIDPEFIEQDDFIQYFIQENPTKLTILIHMSSPKMLQNPGYNGLTSKLISAHPECQHVYIHPDIAQSNNLLSEREKIFGANFPEFFNYTPGNLYKSKKCRKWMFKKL